MMRNISIVLLLSVLSANVFAVSDAHGIECPAGYGQPFVSLFEKVGLDITATSGAAKSGRHEFPELTETEYNGGSVSDVSDNHWFLNYNVANYGNVKVEGSARCTHSGMMSGVTPASSGGVVTTVAGSADTLTLVDAAEMEKNGGSSDGSSSEYCFCKVNSVSVNNGTPITDGSKWAAYGYIAQSDTNLNGRSVSTNCYTLCPRKCLEMLKDTTNNSKKYFREALFANTPIMSESGCVGNTIQITWENANQRDISTNEAATCIFGGDIKTPVKPEGTPQGKIFRGWRFEASDK